jgi:hypothetical protein
MNERTAVIDEDIRSWAEEHKEESKAHYSEILKAGKNGDLPELTRDSLIASFTARKTNTTYSLRIKGLCKLLRL